ncbi:hypothetical protein ACQ4PT_068587 [Festuca glaucescens]
MVVLVTAATMDFEGTLAAAAPDSPIATTIAPIEAASPTESKCASTGGREAKPKAAKKLMSKEEKGVKATKRRSRCKNLKERNAAAAAAQQVEAAAHIAWQMHLKAGAHVGIHPSLAEAMLLVKQERSIGVAPPASLVSSAFWMGRNEGDIQAMIFGGGFVGEVGAGTGTQDQWPQTQDGVDIDGARLFSTQPTHATTVCVDDDEEAPTRPVLTRDDATKKKWESHKTCGFNDDEDKCLCEAWLVTSHDCINDAQQKGKVYWAKVIQEYHERKRHAPYERKSDRTEESIRKRRNYIKQ